MKRIILVTFIFLSLFVLYGSEQDIKPNLISPGDGGNLSIVEESTPTFSWTSVPWAAAYQIVVFKSDPGSMYSYEEISATETPVISKEIRGQATSWTPSSIQRMDTGTNYIWFVQAVDNNGSGTWSEAGSYRVEIPIVLTGIEEKLREKLREKGVSDDTLDDAFTDLRSEVREVVIVDKGKSNSGTGMDGVMGTENSYNTFYGMGAGAATTGSGNSFFGRYAGYHNTSGYDNTFSGSEAGFWNTTGYRNTFLGMGAGLYNTTGNLNTFSGYNAGHFNTTGEDNTFTGRHTGSSNTTGSFNSFFGSGAGFSNTEGNNNTFIGYTAGYSNTTGYYNTFSGMEAGWSNTTGTRNTFSGYRAGYSNTTGYRNTFSGYYAGYYNSTGYNNTFSGYYAGRYNSTGNHNTFSGYYAGYSNTTGNNNTFSGHSAGYSNSIGSGNVFLGNTAGYSETGYNKLYIESDYGSRTTPLIYGEFDNDIVTINGKLGIGTTTPAFPLEVHTTGSNAKIVINRTDGATGHFLAKANFCTFGTASNHPLRMNVNNIPKVFLLPNGNFGLGVQTPLHPLHLASGAHCTSSGVWQNASSRELKENIVSIKSEDAFETLKNLEPVTYNYKLEKDELYAGFIAEDVPELVASKGRKSLGTMDIVAVLTKVTKEQQKKITELESNNREQQNKLAALQNSKEKQDKINAELLKRLEKLEKKQD